MMSDRETAPPKRPQSRGGNMRTGRTLPEIVARMDALRAIPKAERTAEQADELERLDKTHYQRLLRLDRTVKRLERQLADLGTLGRYPSPTEQAAAYLEREAEAVKSGAGVPVDMADLGFAAQRLRACAAGLRAGFHLPDSGVEA